MKNGEQEVIPPREQCVQHETTSGVLGGQQLAEEASGLGAKLVVGRMAVGSRCRSLDLTLKGQRLGHPMLMLQF